jgi:hypothetical protein
MPAPITLDYQTIRLYNNPIGDTHAKILLQEGKYEKPRFWIP